MFLLTSSSTETPSAACDIERACDQRCGACRAEQQHLLFPGYLIGGDGIAKRRGIIAGAGIERLGLFLEYPAQIHHRPPFA